MGRESDWASRNQEKLDRNAVEFIISGESKQMWEHLQVLLSLRFMTDTLTEKSKLLNNLWSKKYKPTKECSMNALCYQNALMKFAPETFFECKCFSNPTASEISLQC